jgi:hypothetical protein
MMHDRLKIIGIYGAVIAALLVFASAASASFGIADFDGEVLNQDGSAATQAGSHPYQASTTINWNTVENAGAILPDGGSPKDVQVELPAGFAGNPQATPTKCTAFQLSQEVPLCPVSSQVGTAIITVGGTSQVKLGVFNMIPPPGVPAQFGFNLSSVPVFLDARVRSAGDYGVTIESPNISQAYPITATTLTFWGVPADPSHDAERACASGAEPPCSSGVPLKPFLTNPSSCTGPVKTSLRTDSWTEPGAFSEEDFLTHLPAPNASTLIGAEGCERLLFEPTLNVAPGSSEAGAPSGYSVDLKLPQNENPVGLAEADLKKAVVALPQGVTVSPSAADGLGACAPAQIALGSEGAPSCSDSSKIGTVQVETPLLEKPLTGAVYLAQQGNNPFGSLLALYVVAEGSGVVIKLSGQVAADPVTGQLTATFDNNPQLPFSELKLDFNGGPRAPLSNPARCGTYTTRSQLTSWSGKTVELASSFAIIQGEKGGACPTGGFSPSFDAGTLSSQAGGFSSFTASFSRRDGEQSLAGIQVSTPPGLLGKLAGVPLCGEAQANAGTCPAASQIGHTTVTAGAGITPISVPVAGQPQAPIYLTAGYKGAPFGLSIVVPAIAGPFNLGTVVVRASIAINPATAALTITSDPLPTILEGIPLQLKTVNVTVDRAGFMFNPTSCTAKTIGATITSSRGASAAVSSPFQAANCAGLPFKPVLTASTAGRASKPSGASLDVKITSGTGQANIAAVKVDLPKQLPSRLTTLQKACLAATFEANPANCPAASNVGMATAVTPVLAQALRGPAYLVSHGGAAFPDLEIVLQGEGVTLILDGNTQIKKGITSSTFKAVPDAPIDSFELKLPTGRYSVFGTNLPTKVKYSLCGQALAMPTAITGQNGAVVKQSTRITVTGCPKAKKATKKKAKKRPKAKKKK